jgi:hypothetical protein
MRNLYTEEIAMDVSIFLARVLGLYFIIVCLAVLFRFKEIRKTFDEMVSNKAHVFFAAFLSLVIGILLVVSHSIFVWDWRLLITLIGYLSLLKGICLLFFPKHMLVCKRVIMSKQHVYYTIIIIFLLIGAFLTYHGFWCGY